MAQTLYCWRCQMEVPMLDELEWARIAPSLSNAAADIVAYRKTHGVSLAEAREHGYGIEALAEYFRITGYRETGADVLWHHRLSLYGRPCTACDTPLRTPQAKHCAECGASAV
jgi:hypothetical protein